MADDFVELFHHGISVEATHAKKLYVKKIHMMFLKYIIYRISPRYILRPTSYNKSPGGRQNGEGLRRLHWRQRRLAVGQESFPFIFGLYESEKMPFMSITSSLLKLGVVCFF